MVFRWQRGCQGLEAPPIRCRSSGSRGPSSHGSLFKRSSFNLKPFLHLSSSSTTSTLVWVFARCSSRPVVAARVLVSNSTYSLSHPVFSSMFIIVERAFLSHLPPHQTRRRLLPALSGLAGQLHHTLALLLHPSTCSSHSSSQLSFLRISVSVTASPQLLASGHPRSYACDIRCCELTRFESVPVGRAPSPSLSPSPSLYFFQFATSIL